MLSRSADRTQTFSWEQATLAHKAGNQEAAQLAMTKVILIEQLLPRRAIAKSLEITTQFHQKLTLIF